MSKGFATDNLITKKSKKKVISNEPQGDQDINLPCGSFEITFFFDFLDIKLSVANPLLIIKIIVILTRTF